MGLFWKTKVRLPATFQDNIYFGKNWHFLAGWEKSTKYFIKMQNAILNGESTFTMLKSDYEEALAYAEKSKKEESIMSKAVDSNNKGIELEKEGKIEEAIKVYEDNLLLNYPARHSYERLMVLYRKKKDKENEIRVIRKALELFPDEEKYLKRLNRMKHE